jgi:glycosyltransferase involved in cell wall biosynthesis
VKVGLVSSTVPLVKGGGRFIVDWLSDKLTNAGHSVEAIWIPFVDDPSEILSQMTAFRLMDFEDSFDRIIAVRPPAHVVQHSFKVVWFIHHLRGFYDLWQTPYCMVPDTAYWRSFRSSLIDADTHTLQEAHRLFTNSKTVSNRLLKYNGLSSEVLYPPVFAPERFHNERWGEEIVCVCRMEHHKRQHLLLAAMQFTRTPVRLRLAGNSTSSAYLITLKELARQFGVEDKVVIDQRWISEDEKITLLSRALAAAYVPLDEDSYGYPTLEAALASKASVSVTDGGGVDEFIIDGQNGFLCEPTPETLAEKFDLLWSDRRMARELGVAARQRIEDLKITWDHVLSRLLS